LRLSNGSGGGGIDLHQNVVNHLIATPLDDCDRKRLPSGAY
jgi:hypothetical protein